MLSRIYPRTITIKRSRTAAAQTPDVGLMSYQGREQTTTPGAPEGEDTIITGVACSIQARRSGRTRGMMVEGDVADKPEWVIMIPPRAVPQYTIRDRDIVIDDEGYRYMVAANYWNSLGWKLMTIRMEV